MNRLSLVGLAGEPLTIYFLLALVKERFAQKREVKKEETEKTKDKRHNETSGT